MITCPLCLSDLFLGSLPALGAKAVKLWFLVGEALIATHPVEPVYGNIEFVVVTERDQHEISLLSGKFHIDQPLEDADTMVPMHDHIADHKLINLDWLTFIARPFFLSVAAQSFFSEEFGG